MGDLELILREIQDKGTRENFQRILRYLQDQVILDGEWQLYEIRFDSAVTNYKFKHNLTFVPQDIIQLQVIGDRNIEFNYDKFDANNLDITSKGPCYIRFLAGRYPDQLLSPTARKGLANVSVGGTTTGSPLTNITVVMDCATGVLIDDWVYQSLTIDNRAIKATNNSPNAPVIGIVIDKPTTTTCEVLLNGTYVLSVSRGKLFLGSGGTAVNTGPTTGYLQTLGVSFGNGTVYINPNLNRVKRA